MAYDDNKPDEYIVGSENHVDVVTGLITCRKQAESHPAASLHHELEFVQRVADGERREVVTSR